MYVKKTVECLGIWTDKEVGGAVVKVSEQTFQVLVPPVRCFNSHKF